LRSAKTLAKQGKNFGFSKVMVFTPHDLSSSFKEANKSTLSLPRGAGYWIWKPWIISEVLKDLNPGDSLLYLDAGVLLSQQATHFQELSRDGRIHLWNNMTSFNHNAHWVDERVWREIVGAELSLSSSPHHWAGAVLTQKNNESEAQVNLWLNLCKQAKFLRPETLADYVPTPRLIGHRHDQSILNCIVHLHTEAFTIHNLQSSGRLNPFIHHRRGNIYFTLHAKLIILSSQLLSKLLSFLPDLFRTKIRTAITRRRKPYVSNDEIERHYRITEI
jgi:hypothetical protein